MMIEDFDIAVAAVARAHGAEVITANLAHVEDVAPVVFPTCSLTCTCIPNAVEFIQAQAGGTG